MGLDRLGIVQPDASYIKPMNHNIIEVNSEKSKSVHSGKE